MHPKARQISIFRHASGITIKAPAMGKPGDVISRIAAVATQPETKAGHVGACMLLQGKTTQGWRPDVLQRDRKPMRIYLTASRLGQAYASTHSSSMAEMLKLCDGKEASEISEIMLAGGFSLYYRTRVLTDANRAAKYGYLTIRKESTAKGK